MSNVAGNLRTWKFHVIATVAAVLLAFVLVEAVLAGLTLAGFRTWYSYTLAIDYDEYVDDISDARIATFRDRAYDPVLGWDTRPEATRERRNSAGREVIETTDARGARTNPYVSGDGNDELTVLTFGESYTYGAEVNDDETWPYLLSRLLEMPIINYGVPAYSPDQALLKMERKIGEHDPDLVIFGIMSENINRLMGMYRPFYRKGTGLYLGFKPMLQAAPNGDMEYLPNPLSRLESKDDVLRAYEIAKQHDYWYMTERRPVWKFPYSVAMLKLLKYRILYRDDSVNPFTRMRDMYRNAEATARLDFVIESVFRLASENDFEAVVVFIPNGPDIRSFASSGVYSYQSYLQRIRATDWGQSGQIIDILEHRFEYDRFNVNRFSGHPSPYGTAVIADVVFNNLETGDRLLSVE